MYERETERERQTETERERETEARAETETETGTERERGMSVSLLESSVLFAILEFSFSYIRSISYARMSHEGIIRQTGPLS